MSSARPPTLLARALLAGLACLGCNSAPEIVQREGLPPARAVALDTWEYRIGPGDVLRVNVFGRPELSSAPLHDEIVGSPVEGDGTLMLPLVGSLAVSGLTTREVARSVEQALARYLKEPHVDVAVVRHGSQRYLVLGEVKLPGVYSLSRPTTPLEALAEAGGLASSANREQVAWVRGTLDAASLVVFDGNRLDPLATQLVAPGDVIFVGRRRWADVGEGARDLIPLLQSFSIPLSLAIQAITLEKID